MQKCGQLFFSIIGGHPHGTGERQLWRAPQELPRVMSAAAKQCDVWMTGGKGVFELPAA